MQSVPNIALALPDRRKINIIIAIQKKSHYASDVLAQRTPKPKKHDKLFTTLCDSSQSQISSDQNQMEPFKNHTNLNSRAETPRTVLNSLITRLQRFNRP